MITYEQAKSDRNYLFSTYGAAYDMTGGFVEGEKLELLLGRPTKAHARNIYIAQINYWFESGHDVAGSDRRQVPDLADHNLVKIAERYAPAYICA